MSQSANEEEREKSNRNFQQIGFAYAVLKDEIKRRRYDESGRTDEGFGGEKTEQGWKDYFKGIWTGEVNATTVEEFTKKYQGTLLSSPEGMVELTRCTGSEEELADLYAKYQESQGSLETILSSIMCSTYQDEDRFTLLINNAIIAKTLPSFPAWKKSMKNQKKGKIARMNKGKAEELEAEKYAKELAVYDQLNGGGGGNKKGKGKAKKGEKEEVDDEAGLRALIQGNQAKKLDAMIDSIAAKYEAKEDRKQKRRSSDESDSGPQGGKKKRAAQTEPSEEEFRLLQEAMEKRRGENGNGGAKKKGGKSS